MKDHVCAGGDLIPVEASVVVEVDGDGFPCDEWSTETTEAITLATLGVWEDYFTAKARRDGPLAHSNHTITIVMHTNEVGHASLDN